ncbi:MAG: secretin N-terminal domain-containing protein [Acidobacteriota bacterium]
MSRSRALGMVLFVALLAAAGAVAAPEGGSGDEKELVSRTFTVRYRSVDDVVSLIQPAISARGSYAVQPRLKSITVTDDTRVIERIAFLIAGYDLPPRQIGLVVQLMRAEEGPRDPSARERRSRRIGLPPAVIQDLTKWGVITPIGSAVITTAENESGIVAMGERYRVRFTLGSVSMDIGVIRMERFVLEKYVAGRDGGAARGAPRPVMDLVLNLRDHQTTVLGATSSQDSKQALFVSVRADIKER